MLEGGERRDAGLRQLQPHGHSDDRESRHGQAGLGSLLEPARPLLQATLRGGHPLEHIVRHAFGFFFAPSAYAESLPGNDNTHCSTILKSLQLEITYQGKGETFP